MTRSVRRGSVAAGLVSSATAAEVATGLTLAVAAISTAPLFVLLAAPLEPPVIAGARVVVTGLALALLAPGSMAALVAHLRARPALVGRVALAGLLLAVHFGTWIASLQLTSVLRSTTLVTTQPLFAGILGRFIGDRASPGVYVGAVVAVGGTVLMMDPTRPGADEGAILGDALALVGAVASAGYFTVGRSLRGQLDLGGYLSAVHLTAAACLGLVVWSLSVPLFPGGSTSADFGAVVYLGLVPGVVGHGLLNWAVRHLPVHLISMVVLLEPVGATTLAAVILDRPVGGWEVVGAAVLLFGVALGIPWRR